MVRGTISEMPPEDREKVAKAEADILAAIAKYPEGHGQMALAVVAAKVAAEG